MSQLTTAVARGQLIPAVCFLAGLTQQVAVAQEPTHVTRGAYHAEVSPDGSRVAFGLLGDIWILPIDGGDARSVTSGHGWDHHPTWSPDGDLIAYVHDSPASSEIRLHTLATGTTRTLYARAPRDVVASSRWGTVFSFGQLRFHPLSGEVYFIDFRTGIWSVGTRGSPRNEPVQHFTGSGRLGRPGITENSSFAFRRDGSAIVVERDTTDLWTNLYVGDPGGNVIPLFPADRRKRTSAEWTPDGSIAYIEQFGGIEYLAVTHPGSVTTQRIELGAYTGREATIHPGGDAIVTSGGEMTRINFRTRSSEPIRFIARVNAPTRTSGELVVINATLFEGIADSVVPNAHVTISSGVIESIASGPVPDTTGRRVIDARGRFVMPGLVEAHDHAWSGGKFQQSTTLTRGVTTVFNPGSVLPEIQRLQAAIRLGILEGPRLLTSGPTIDGPEGRSRPFTVANVTDPEAARVLVRELHSQGVDAIKVYAFLEAEVVRALTEQAHSLGLPVIADLVTTTWSQALDFGVDGLIHLMDHKWRFLSTDSIADPDDPWAVVQPDSAVMHNFFQRAAAANLMFDPTMMGSARLYSAEDFREAYTSDDPSDEAAVRTQTLGVILRTIHRSGAEWVAGTDIGPSRLIDELEIYEVVGIPNAAILRTTTSNVARWLKKDDFGTISPGLRADLIVIDGDPLSRVRDLENVVAVVQEGRVVYRR